MVVGSLLSCWEGNCSGAMLNFRRVRFILVYHWSKDLNKMNNTCLKTTCGNQKGNPLIVSHDRRFGKAFFWDSFGHVLVAVQGKLRADAPWVERCCDSGWSGFLSVSEELSWNIARNADFLSAAIACDRYVLLPTFFGLQSTMAIKEGNRRYQAVCKARLLEI